MPSVRGAVVAQPGANEVDACAQVLTVGERVSRLPASWAYVMHGTRAKWRAPGVGAASRRSRVPVAVKTVTAEETVTAEAVTAETA
ncbi:hypothetical protein ABT084_00410 [Streptomyces sp. NPDC002138]|uniref:hypothetical protein n=1 Tax=Streptomyces sp. NPDC002138 TaxID=3154410 RepID=UPI003330353D